MSTSNATPPKPRFAIASLSLGSFLYHTLPDKIVTAAKLGYDGIEIFMPDFEDFVRQVSMGLHTSLFPLGLPSPLSTPDLELLCATAIGDFATSHGLSIPVLQPFRDFEAIGHSPSLLSAALARAERWLRLMPAMRTDLLLVCSNNLLPLDPSDTPWERYRDDQVVAMRALGELAARYGVRIGYEPLAWGTVVNRWEQVWEVVQRVDMPNVGVILDSFNSLGQQYADPSSPSSVRPPHELAQLAPSLSLLTTSIPPHKIFLLQLADAARPSSPFLTSKNAPARMKWSRTSRLFPCEKERGAFLPVEQYTAAVMQTGFGGWWSLEVFNSSLESDGEGCMEEHGGRGIRGLEGLWESVRSGAWREEGREGKEGRAALRAQAQL